MNREEIKRYRRTYINDKNNRISIDKCVLFDLLNMAEESLDCKEINLGSGKILISTVERGKRIGLLFEDTCINHPIGSKPDLFNNVDYNPQRKDCIVWVDSLDAGRVLQDRVNIVCLSFNGFAVDLVENNEKGIADKK